MIKVQLKTLLLATAFMSVVCWFASVFMAEMTHPRFGLVLAIGCGLLTAGSAMIFFGALILGMWPESDWAQRYDFWRSFDGLRISGDVHCPDATAIIACRFTPMATATQHCCLLLLEEVTCS